MGPETIVEMYPRVDDSFAWQHGPLGDVLVCRPLLTLAPHAFSTRQLQFRGPSEPADMAKLAKALAVSPSAIVTVKQVHGRRILTVPDDDAIQAQQEADAIISLNPRRAIAVRVADCVPILLADRQRRIVAAVHAGWRGTAAGIALSTVQAIDGLGVAPRDLVAAIGPSAGACCYQVDDKVRTTFLGTTPDAAAWFSEDGPGHWRLDLWQANVDQLMDAGVPADSISVVGLCTQDAAEVCFSYRREGAATGRMVAAIKLVPGS